MLLIYPRIFPLTIGSLSLQGESLSLHPFTAVSSLLFHFNSCFQFSCCECVLISIECGFFSFVSIYLISSGIGFWKTAEEIVGPVDKAKARARKQRELEKSKKALERDWRLNEDSSKIAGANAASTVRSEPRLLLLNVSKKPLNLRRESSRSCREPPQNLSPVFIIAPKVEREASELSGTVRKRMEFLDFD
ncbi:unnamed protein product [Microthlaspi erraticum]|uniref:Uncharacterized protein n=1 Tax=Microthlaspi erraticum TaxID=1685480 RepID=A0A6D2L3E3_9BRAS|nr:unnamed protein product [Microthlaspi erraticum]